MQIPKMTDEQRRDIRRIISGDWDNDQLRRRDIIEVIRQLRVTDISLRNPDTYQRALSDVQRAIGKLPYTEAKRGDAA